MKDHDENEMGSQIIKNLASHAKEGELYSQGKQPRTVGFKSVVWLSITLKEWIWEKM